MKQFQNKVAIVSIFLGIFILFFIIWISFPTKSLLGSEGPSHSEVSIALSPNSLEGGMIIPACGESLPGTRSGDFRSPDDTLVSPPAQKSGNDRIPALPSVRPSVRSTSPSISTQHMYYCRVSDRVCVQSSGSYPTVASCQSSLQTYLPGQTTGACYLTLNSCQVNCAGTTAPNPFSFSAPTITTTNLPNATIGQPYQANISATGGTGSYVWSISSGSLPPGLALQYITCVSSPCQVPIYIVGTPTVAGTYTFTMQIYTDGVTATGVFTINSLGM